VRNLSNQTWQIEFQCPQCGAPVTLEETDRLFGCSYCRVRLYISSREYFRYYLAPPGASLKDILFIPYWRFRGMVFSCKDNDIQQRIADTSLLAMNLGSSVPPTLGIRPQVLKLSFVTPEAGGVFPNPLCRFKGLAAGASNSPGFAGECGRKLPGYYEAFIGETLSLIYSPIRIQGGMIHDAILKRPLAALPQDLTGALTSNPYEEHSMEFLPTICPHCGWDLQGEKDTLVLHCKNCDSLWEAEEGALRKVDFEVVASSEESAVHLPFWRIRARVTGLELDSYADLVEVANLPKAVRSEWNRLPMFFWIPAFKVHPQLFLRLIKVLTIFQPQDETQRQLPGSPLYPVTLPLGEAVESINVAIANMAVPRRLIFPRLSEIQVSLEAHLLHYLPFIPRGGELIHPSMQVSIDKNALKMGRLI